jgi:hypothetical protein
MAESKTPKLKKDGTPRQKPGPKPGTRNPQSTFNPKVVEEILNRHSEGELITDLVAEKGIKWWTFQQWVKRDVEGLAERYRDAREAFWEYMADASIKIARDGSHDFIETNKGPVLDKEAVMRSKLHVDTLQWLLSKRQPSRYGDKTQLEVTGKDGGPVQHEHRESAREKVLGELDQTRRRLEGANQNSSTGSANGHANGKANGHG